MTGIADNSPRGTRELHSNAVITDGQWHHLQLIYDQTYHRIIYVDGVEVARDEQALQGHFTPMSSC